MSAQTIVGAWEIERAEFEEASGRILPRGNGPRALLVFTASGRMSLALNEGRPGEEAFRCLCYAGSYRVEGDRILHCISVSHDPAEVGAELVRTFRWVGDLLELRMPATPEGVGVCYWRRAD